MGSTEQFTDGNQALTLERLGDLAPGTLAMLGELVEQANWNQTADDWAVFFANGTIYVVRDGAGKIVASGAVLPLGASRPGHLAGLTGRGVAWIGMIIVRPEWRARGLARRVFDQCVRHVKSQDRIPLLDATPIGEALYTQFGFDVLWRLTRWRRGPQPRTRPDLPAAMPDIESLAELDQEALGFSRTEVLQALFGRAGTRFIRRPLGFAIVRAGRVAHQLGPIVATNEETAIALMRDAAGSCAGPLLIDVPDERPLLRQALLDAGFAPERSFARMALATAEQRVPRGQTHFIQAIAGPEFA